VRLVHVTLAELVYHARKAHTSHLSSFSCFPVVAPSNQSFSLLLTHLLQLFVPANSSSTLCILFDQIILYYCKVTDLLKGQSNRAVIWIKKLTDYSCIAAAMTDFLTYYYSLLTNYLVITIPLLLITVHY